MKVHCPECGLVLPAENVSLETGWGKCGNCHEVFPLQDVLDGYCRPPTRSEATADRPFDARAIVRRMDDSLVIHIPPEGMRFGTWWMLGFTTFWLAFVAFWTAGALGLFWGAMQGGVQLENALFAAFSIPFWIIGFGMLGFVLWSARGSRSVLIDAVQLVTELKCLVWRRRRTIDRSRVQYARIGDAPRNTTAANTPGESPRYIVELIFDKGSFALPCDTTAERDWLLSEINEFLKLGPPGISFSSGGHTSMPLRLVMVVPLMLLSMHRS